MTHRGFDRAAGVLAAVVILVSARPAVAQRPRPREFVPAFELSVGAGVFGGGGSTTRDAAIRVNGQTSQPYRLFSTTTRWKTAPLLDVRLGANLSRRVGLEARFGFSSPDIETSVTGDVEGAPALAVVERVDRYAIDGGIVVRIDEWGFAGFTPFVTAGAGYLRQVHAGQTLVDGGLGYHLGGGVRRSLVERKTHFLKAVGVRGDVRLDVLSGSLALTDRNSAHLAATGSLVVGF